MKSALRVLGAFGLMGAGAAQAQPALAFRFSNGQSIIQGVMPGSSLPVSVYATGMPNAGLPIPWPGPGTGQVGTYAGFLSVLMNVNASSAGAVSWSNPTIPGGMGYQLPPFGSPGTPAGPSVMGINIGVGFNPPVTGNEFLLWQGTITVGSSDVNLSTAIQPVGSPPMTGVEVGLGGIIPGLIVSHFMSAAEGGGRIVLVPAPGAGALLALAGGAALRRRRPAARWPRRPR